MYCGRPQLIVFNIFRRLGLLKDMSKGLPVKQSIFQFVDRGNEEYTYDIMCKVERGEVSLQEAKQKYRMILDKRKAKINTAKRLSTIEGEIVFLSSLIIQAFQNKPAFVQRNLPPAA